MVFLHRLSTLFVALLRRLGRLRGRDAALLLRRFCALLFSFEGRIGRRGFWFGSLSASLAIALLERGLFALAPTQGPLAGTLLGAAAIYPFGALASKRGLDRGHGPNWGVVLVLATVTLATVSRAPFGQMSAALLSALSVALWLYGLIELGLLPARTEGRPASDSRSANAVGEEPAR